MIGCFPHMSGESNWKTNENIFLDIKKMKFCY